MPNAPCWARRVRRGENPALRGPIVTKLFNFGPAVILSLVLFETSIASAGRIPSYTIADLGTLGGTESFAYAINDRGEIVGSSRLSGNTSTHGFLFGRGTLTDLSPLNSGQVQTVGPTDINNHGRIASGLMQEGIYSAAIYDSRTGQITSLGSLGGVAFGSFNGTATSINDFGDVVGYSYLDDQNRHAFLYQDGLLRDLGSLGGYSAALSINNDGDVAGFSSESVTGWAHAFIYRDGVMIEINPFGDSHNESIARALNNKGELVGYGINGQYTNGFIYADGAITTIGTLPGGQNSLAYSINDRSQIVGVADSPYDDFCDDFATQLNIPCVKYSYQGFLYQDGEMTDLRSLIAADSGWDALWAFDINKRGQITGYGLRAGGFRAFVMTPAPKPFTNTGKVPGLLRH